MRVPPSARGVRTAKASTRVGAFLFKKLLNLNQSNKWFTINKHLTANAISLTGLVSWEFIQISSTKLHFDWNDVLWTAIGAVLFQLIWTMSASQHKERNEETATSPKHH